MLESIESVSPVVAMIAITLTVVAIVVAKIFFASKDEVKQVRLEQQQITSELNTAFDVIKKLEQSTKSTRVAHDALQLQLQECVDMLAVNSEKIQSIQSHTQEIDQRDPQIKLYAKASTLLAEGANIDDIMAACDLDRAEVELLKNLHTNN
jgi:septal ring factor EnvC (AmiA/AmiB activator)